MYIFCFQENTFTPHRLPTPPGKSFWSLSYDPSTRLVLVVCRPAPLSTHLVYELTSTTLDTGTRVVTLNEVSLAFFGSDRSSRSHNVRLFVRSFRSNLSRALNLHHSGSNLQAISQV